METYNNVQYSQLFNLKRGGMYHYFKTRVINRTIRNVFIGHVFLVLIVLISISLQTQSILHHHSILLICYY